MHHALAIEAEAEEGIRAALDFVERELGVTAQGNPDVAVLRYGLFSVEDARRVSELAAGGAFVGEHKVVIISASRAYHEAQNALLKVFEEPPAGTHLFLIMPSLGGLLPTLRSRVQVMNVKGFVNPSFTKPNIPEIAREFLAAGKERRSAMIKRLTSGKDEEQKRELRDEAIALVGGIEAAAFAQGVEKHSALLSDIAALRTHLYDRSAPVRMILEHLALVIPKDLV